MKKVSRFNLFIFLLSRFDFLGWVCMMITELNVEPLVCMSYLFKLFIKVLCFFNILNQSTSLIPISTKEP